MTNKAETTETGSHGHEISRLGVAYILEEPTPGAGDGDGGGRVLLQPIEAGGKTAERLEMADGAFDAIALAIKSAFGGALELARSAW